MVEGGVEEDGEGEDESCGQHPGHQVVNQLPGDEDGDGDDCGQHPRLNQLPGDDGDDNWDYEHCGLWITLLFTSVNTPEPDYVQPYEHFFPMV